ncbi:hypothetical protein EDB19DRAFT_1746692 [Suillus lakei]|nr:hypothetical protein EDB19DRAFT_1746692 [Suillus lakei]
MYGVLYALSPELFPTKDRGTGNAIVATANRIFGVMVSLSVVDGTCVPCYSLTHYTGPDHCSVFGSWYYLHSSTAPPTTSFHIRPQDIWASLPGFYASVTPASVVVSDVWMYVPYSIKGIC